ncbi:hypothetical protein HZA99_02235 [Candidatus Woesearchaeota archaeon]|nr:hypothetical protein [Candidatus Woesearchaeota archaeon]
MADVLFNPDKTGIATQLPLSLEPLVARDVTLLLSKQGPRVLKPEEKGKQSKIASRREASSSALAPVSHALGFHDASPLIPARLLSDELNWIGVYGIGVDPHTNHTWFSTNWIDFLHELDPTFDLVKAHSKKEDPIALFSPNRIRSYGTGNAPIYDLATRDTCR